MSSHNGNHRHHSQIVEYSEDEEYFSEEEYSEEEPCSSDEDYISDGQEQCPSDSCESDNDGEYDDERRQWNEDENEDDDSEQYSEDEGNSNDGENSDSNMPYNPHSRYQVTGHNGPSLDVVPVRNYLVVNGGTTRHFHGYLRDPPDIRDHHYIPPKAKPHATRVDLRRVKHIPPIYDQGSMGSCVANAVAAAFLFDIRKQRVRKFDPSRLFIWYNAREMLGGGAVKRNSGTYIRDAIKSLDGARTNRKAFKGVCGEGDWPYEPCGRYNSKTDVFVKGARAATRPPKRAYANALRHKATKYMRVKQSLNDLRHCLLEGYPFVFGFTTFPALDSEKVRTTGKLDMPKKGQKSTGAHAVLAVGFDDEKKHFIVQNSWGAGWGDRGYFMMPYNYMLNKNWVDDIWTLRVVT